MKILLPLIDFASLNLKSIVIRIAPKYFQGIRYYQVSITLDGCTHTFYKHDEKISRSDLFALTLEMIGLAYAPVGCGR